MEEQLQHLVNNGENMVGANKIILNDATIADMVTKHFNEHVVKESHVCTKVDKEYDGKQYIWVATIEPKTETINV